MNLILSEDFSHFLELFAAIFLLISAATFVVWPSMDRVVAWTAWFSAVLLSLHLLSDANRHFQWLKAD